MRLCAGLASTKLTLLPRSGTTSGTRHGMYLGLAERFFHGRKIMPQVPCPIKSKPEDNFVRTRCSACPDVRFHLVSNTLAEKTLLRQMFDIHFRQVHIGEETIRATDSAK